MKVPVFFTILGVAACVLGITTPAVSILAVFAIYFAWKAYDFNEANEKTKKELEEIKKLLQTQREEKAAAESENPQPNTDAGDSES